MSKELPKRLIEKGKTWERAKTYVLDQLAQRGEISRTDIVKELNANFEFNYDTAGYGVIKALLKLNKIHYTEVGGKVRTLALGPGTGVVRLAQPEKKPQPIVLVEPEEEEEEIVAIASASYDDEGFKPMELTEEEKLAEVVEQEVPASTMPTPVAEMTKEPEPPKPLVVDDSELERLAMEKVVADTAKKIISAVDRELERALSPTIRAQLRLVYAMAAESGIPIQRSSSPLAQRDALRKLFV